MLFYRLILTLVSLISLPFFIYKYFTGKTEWKWRLGFGRFPQTQKKRIWIHASSVGEINGIESLVKEFTNSHPQCFIYLSTMTTTGLERAEKIAEGYSDRIFPFILPLDIPFCIDRVLQEIKPELLILTETEIWPLLIYNSKKQGTEIVIINGRMTERSFGNYKKFRFLFSKIISEIDFIAVQAEIDKTRYSFFKKKDVEILGNLKFAINLQFIDKRKKKKEWQISAEYIVAFGSSRPGEEEIVVELHKFLDSQKINHQIILAPRHLNRIAEVEKILKRNRVEFIKLSEISDLTDEAGILLVDKMGELTSAYSICDVAIIGGSFYDFSGHNPLEAAFYGKPILMGKYHSSCKKTVDILKENNAIKIVDKTDLSDILLQLYENIAFREKLGENAKLTLKQNGDSLPETLNLLEKYIS